MKIIIAPSKTMKYQKTDFKTTPLLFPKENQYLKEILLEYNDEQLCELMHISYKQALKVYDDYHLDHKSHPALSLYQGTVFRELQFDQYKDHLDYLEEHLRILSAYYGVLLFHTGITPYRLDMTMKLPHLNLYEYWYTPLYQYFENEDLIISLSSKEFMSMVHHPGLYFIDFMEIINDKIRRNGFVVKKARGQMLNQMILHEIQTLDELKTLNIDGFIYDPHYDQDHSLAFVKRKENP